MIRLHCYYSLSSPWAYFGGPRLAALTQAYEVKLELRPFDFQAIVPHTGGIPLRTRPQERQTYHALELARWSKRLKMPINLVPRYYRKHAVPSDWNKLPGWTVIAAQQAGLDAQALSHALLKALWVEERDTADASVRVEIADSLGMPGVELVTAEQGDLVQAAYREFSEQARLIGVFGSPTYVIEAERFWGQDRLDFLEERLIELSRT